MIIIVFVCLLGFFSSFDVVCLFVCLFVRLFKLQELVLVARAYRVFHQRLPSLMCWLTLSCYYHLG